MEQQIELPRQHIYVDTYSGGVRDTSIESFRKIIESLSDKRIRIFRAIQELGGKATNRQISIRLSWTINRVTGRVNEMVKLGALRYGGKTYDRITKKNVCFWEINN